MVSQIKKEFNGQELILESGKMARQASGSVVLTYGDLVIFAPVGTSPARPGTDFFPLTVDYRERTSAVGRFPGGYLKREGRATEKDILTCRLIDRPIRPLFPKGFYDEVQLLPMVLSADTDNDPDVHAIVASSAALLLSELPFTSPVGAVRVGRINGEFVINPTYKQLEEESEIDLVIAGTADAVMMVEGSGLEISEDVMIEAVLFGHAALQPLIEMQLELQKLCGKEKIEFVAPEPDAELEACVREFLKGKIEEKVFIKEKHARSNALGALKEELKEYVVTVKEEWEEQLEEVSSFFGKVEKEIVREAILTKNERTDGRKVTEIRPITIEAGMLPRSHGSALFTRGETQALATAILGNEKDQQRMDTLGGEVSKSFMLHYNFPPYCVGEARPVRGPGRREIGHGHLAQRALEGVLPKNSDFPYTIKLVSDIMESNGSSSMATVCGGTLAMMDAGVPIKAPVAGIAMGLVKEGDDIAVLSDILGQEDAMGDMDFKVTGTKNGITAFQMDIKIKGIDREIMTKALEQAKEGRMHILGEMAKVLPETRSELSKYAPQIEVFNVPADKIGAIIGPGGKNIKKIIEEAGVDINIDDHGKVTVFSPSGKDNLTEGVRRVKLFVEEVEVGKVYTGLVKNVLDFGAFVEVLPGKEGLLHISKIANHRVEKVTDEINTGDTVEVKVMDIDNRGRINLSRKELLKDDKK